MSVKLGGALEHAGYRYDGDHLIASGVFLRGRMVEFGAVTH